MPTTAAQIELWHSSPIEHQRLEFKETSNQSLRARFHLSEGKSVVVSQVIAATVEAGLIKAEDEAAGRKFARYVPFGA